MNEIDIEQAEQARTRCTSQAVSDQEWFFDKSSGRLLLLVASRGRLVEQRRG